MDAALELDEGEDDEELDLSLDLLDELLLDEPLDDEPLELDDARESVR